jgi:mRNA interferase MazF
VICDAGDVVVVPFPFTDRMQSKRRPALALSQPEFNADGHTVLAMITSSGGWVGDVPLPESIALTAGLAKSSRIRVLKIFTLDNRLILRKLGRLSELDWHTVDGVLRQHIGGRY